MCSNYFFLFGYKRLYLQVHTSSSSSFSCSHSIISKPFMFFSRFIFEAIEEYSSSVCVRMWPEVIDVCSSPGVVRLLVTYSEPGSIMGIVCRRCGFSWSDMCHPRLTLHSFFSSSLWCRSQVRRNSVNSFHALRASVCDLRLLLLASSHKYKHVCISLVTPV